MNSRHGTAFIIVLWLIVVLGSLVSAFAIVAVHSGKMIQSTRHIGQTQEIAEAGAEAWLGKVREHSIFGEQDLLLTEIMPYHKHQGLQITQLGITGTDDESDWFEVYNPTDQDIELCGYTVASGPTPPGESAGEEIQDLNEPIPSGEYIYICTDEDDCEEAFGGLDTTADTFEGLTQDGSNFPFDGSVRAIVIGQDLQPNDTEEEVNECNVDNFWNDHVVDRVSWTVEGQFSPPGKGLDRVGHEWFFIEPFDRASENENEPMALKRRFCSQDDDEFCDGTRPLNSFDNDNDFEEAGDPEIGETPDPADYSPYDDSSLDHPYPTQINFFEVYNTTSNTIDIENTTYTLETESSDDTFELVPMPENPDEPDEGSWDADLGPGDVGVVLHPEADAEGAMGMADLLNDEDVRVFATVNSAGEYQFPPLNQDKMDRVTLSKPSPADDQTAVEAAQWSPTDNTVYESRELFDPSDPESRDFWAGMLDGGTPGVWDNVLGIDWYGAPYGWLAEFSTGTSLSDEVYVPSFESTRQDGDIGYFRFLRIEDESGKMDLLHPRSPDQFVAPNASDRHNMVGTSSNLHETTFNKPAEEWITHGDLIEVSSSWNNDIYEGQNFSSMYTPYRERRGPHQTGLINVNMASYEALASVPRAVVDGDTEYLTTSMIRTLINERSTVDGDVELFEQVEDGEFPELSRASFPETDDADPFTSTQQACETVKDSTTEPVDCTLFSDHTTVVSDGVLTLEVLGVRTNDQGEEISRVRKRITVDRRNLRDGTGPLNVIYSRFLSEDLPGFLIQ